MQPSTRTASTGLPNVVVRSAGDDRVVVDFLDPAVMVDLVGEKRVHEIAEDVRARLEMARDDIATAVGV